MCLSHKNKVSIKFGESTPFYTLNGLFGSTYRPLVVSNQLSLNNFDNYFHKLRSGNMKDWLTLFYKNAGRETIAENGLQTQNRKHFSKRIRI